ncbi:hydroxysqualene dehydroxylase [Serpentinimonas barnesii]|uniref:hydroxysqualene dehydroxylase n=1 Tax=Serpentinimonas barnesii TaxID=1458427 RepID=UPI00097170E3|nr:FAD-dependent oxidoreductase [Serpentinimonas barnesii]
MNRRVLIVGGGWAGLAAAVRARERGCRVTLLEAARVWGGRARALEPAPGVGGLGCAGGAGGAGGADPHSATDSAPGHAHSSLGAQGLHSAQTMPLDNGQHILIGAYTQTLGLLQRLGLHLPDHLHAMPLDLRFADGSGLATPDWAQRWPAPLDTVAAIACARGWNWRDRAALLAAAARWRRLGFACPPGESVAGLCAGLPQRVWQDLIEPLCVAALNTPAQQASAQVFLTVLRDALLGAGHPPWRASQLLLPRTCLGDLLPLAAVRWLSQQGAELHLGQRALGLERSAHGAWRLHSASAQYEADRVILACPAHEAARLLRTLPEAPAQWVAQAAALQHTAIGTVYVAGWLRQPWPSAHPMLALRSSGSAAPAQFAFRRDWLQAQPTAALAGRADLASGHPAHSGPAANNSAASAPPPPEPGAWAELALVASACSTDKATLQAAVLDQARQALGLHGEQVRQTVIEKRATFACTPGLQRPSAAIAPGLWAAGDYLQGPYPATLEAAVRSGLEAAERCAG